MTGERDDTGFELGAVCIDEQTALDLAAGWLPADDAAAVRAHVTSCDRCAELVAAALADDDAASGDSSQSAAQTWQLAPGETIGGYTIQAKIGEGASGCVYRAERAATVGAATAVAIKVLKPIGAAAAADRRDLRAEVSVGVDVHSEYVCRILEVVDEVAESGRLALVLELAAHSLRWELEHVWGSRTLGQRIECGLSVSQGLAALHAAGFLHRDLKPENVLRMPDGRLVLSDFGLATRPTEPTGVAHTVGVGTWRYMAPEQREVPAAIASDVYALGLVLHEIFFGVMPSRNEATLSFEPDREVATAHSERQLLAICAGCLALAPGERPRSVASVVARLRRTLGSERGDRRLNARWFAAVLGTMFVAAAAFWFGRSSVGAHEREQRVTNPATTGRRPDVASDVPQAGEIDIKLDAEVPSKVSVCPSDEGRNHIPGAPQRAEKPKNPSDLARTLWRVNEHRSSHYASFLGIGCVELLPGGVFLGYYDHRWDKYVKGGWTSSKNRMLDLEIPGARTGHLIDFHWTVSLPTTGPKSTVVAKDAVDKDGTVVLQSTDFESKKQTGCSSATITRVDTGRQTTMFTEFGLPDDRAGSRFDAFYVLSKIKAKQAEIDACFLKSINDLVPHETTRWRLSHNGDGRVTAARWFAEAPDPEPEPSELTGCLVKVLVTLDFGSTVATSADDEEARFRWRSGKRNTSVRADSRPCAD